VLNQSHDHDNIQLNPKIQNPTEILMECCRSQIQAGILTLQGKRVYYHARMVLVSSNLLSLRLTRKMMEAPAPGAECYFSFTSQNNSLSFFSNVLEYHHHSPDKYTELILDIRSGIMRREPRLAYRVNVMPGSQLVVNVITDDGLNSSPRVRDLSLIGIGLDFSGRKAMPKLEVGSCVKLELHLPSNAVRLKGEARYRTGLKYGISFSKVNTKHGIKPPPAPKNIVDALDREWLREISRT
jgi:hypothetical protein